MKIVALGWTFSALFLPAFLWAGPRDTAKIDYRTGLELYQQGRYEQALERFQFSSDEDWNFWQSYQMAGYCYFELREKDSALSAFKESLRIHPDNPQLARIYADLRAGALEVPIRPVDGPQPTGTPAFRQVWYSYNK
jgi:tetratricopeptide (TPR) repeat protein